MTLIPTTRPSIRAWLDDEHYLLSERDDNEKSTKLYKVNAKTGKKTVFLNYEQIQKTFPKGLKANQHTVFTQDYSGLLHSFENDLYYYSLESKRLKRLTSTPGEEKNPRFSPDGRYIAFTRNHNLYLLNVESRLEYQFTSDSSDTILQILSHGVMDDNVHMQNSVQLIDKLIDLGKKFEFMLYPDQRYSLRDKKRTHSNRHYVDFWFKNFLNR